MTYSKSVASTVYPKLHQIPNCIPNIRILPVQIRLLRDEQMQVIFLRLVVILPCRTCDLILVEYTDRKGVSPGASHKEDAQLTNDQHSATS